MHPCEVAMKTRCFMYTRYVTNGLLQTFCQLLQASLVLLDLFHLEVTNSGHLSINAGNSNQNVLHRVTHCQEDIILSQSQQTLIISYYAHKFRTAVHIIVSSQVFAALNFL